MNIRVDTGIYVLHMESKTRGCGVNLAQTIPFSSCKQWMEAIISASTALGTLNITVIREIFVAKIFM